MVGEKSLGHRGSPGVEYRVMEVRLLTDDGKAEIIATRNTGLAIDHNRNYPLLNDRATSTDCHGVTFTEGKYWINNDQVDTILKHDNYRQLGANDKAVVGDVAVYRDRAGNVVHTATVTKVDKNGKPATVEGLGGIQSISMPTSPEAQFPNSTQTSSGYAVISYYHKNNESKQDRERRVSWATNYYKQ